MCFRRTLLPSRTGCDRRACRGPDTASAYSSGNRAGEKLGSDAQYQTGWRAAASTRTRCIACLRERMDEPPAGLLRLEQRENFLHATTSWCRLEAAAV